MGLSDQNLFSADDEFFIITSDSLDGVRTRLYGWTLVDGRFVTDAAALSGRAPSPEGCYVYILREGGTVTVSQDFTGCYGLYLFREGDWWALSNSFLYLVERLKGAHRLTFNKAYADYFVANDLCSHTYAETMVDEIELLDRSAVLSADVSTGHLDIALRPYGENTVELDSAEGMELLDAWYGRWTGVIRNLGKLGAPLETDLSGGFDSRQILSLFLGSGVDMGGVCVDSIDDGLHTHAEDYAIASRIASAHGFELNNREPLAGGRSHCTVEDALNISFYTKLGFHKQMHWAFERREEYAFKFTGFGGENTRSYWAEKAEGSEERLVSSFARKGFAFKADGAGISRSIDTLSRKALKDIREKFAAFGMDRGGDVIFTDLYRETRNRSHFGKWTLEDFLGGTITCSPLLDSELERLKLCTDECPDEDLLFAVMLDRYNSGLLEFGFDSGRSFAPETLEYAHALNVRFPVNVPERDGGAADCTLPRPSAPAGVGREEPLTDGEMAALMEDAFYSPEARGTFEILYSPDTYYQLAERFKNPFYPESEAYSVLAVDRVLSACMDSEDAAACGRISDYVLRQAGRTSAALRPGSRPVDPLVFARCSTARIDIKDEGGPGNDVQILDLSDDDALTDTPKWFDDEKGRGHEVSSAKGRLDLRLRCVGDGTLDVVLRCIYMQDADGKHIPMWIEFTRMEVDGEQIFAGPDSQVVWHDRPYHYRREVRDGEEVLIFLAWRPFNDGERLRRAEKEVGQLRARAGEQDGEIKRLRARAGEQDGEIKRLSQMLTARVDVKDAGAPENDVEVLELSDSSARVEAPAWFGGEDGTGRVVRSDAGSLGFRVRCSGAGELELALRGQYVRDADGERVPVWIDYTSFSVDGRELLGGTRAVWHDRPFKHRMPVTDGQVVAVSLAWHSHDEAGLEAERGRVDAAHDEAEALRAESERLQGAVAERDAALETLRAAEKREHAARAAAEADALALRSSNSWKVGRFITWLPRKIKDWIHGLER